MDKWEKLKQEMDYLIGKGVTSIHPLLVLQYMGFIDQLAAAEEDLVAAMKDE